MKYVIFTVDYGGFKKELYITHANHLAHSQAFDYLKAGIESEQSEYSKRKPKVKAVAAGFIVDTSAGIECYGESVSLKLKSRGFTDARIIERDYGE